MFSKKDLQQIKKQGSNAENVMQQLERFSTGFPYLNIIAPAEVDNGIIRLNGTQVNEYISYYGKKISEGIKPLKFVPASGAATRMFKGLYAFRHELDRGTDPEELLNQDTHKAVKLFFEDVERFAFYPELMQLLKDKEKSPAELIDCLLTGNGLNYGELPKGLLKFHSYADGTRTPFEEHLVEGADYSKTQKGDVAIHFTVSPQHKSLFGKLFEQAKEHYQQLFGVQYQISWSEQKTSTDTIAATPENEPFRTTDGKLLFRPGGHGALIENLNDLDADLIFIKNIDNVAPDHLREDTYRYKKALAGYLLQIREKLYFYQMKLNTHFYYGLNSKLLGEIVDFLQNVLNVKPPEELYYKQKEELVPYLREKINRPLRICGMVVNEGEPGGGPYWVTNADNTVSLQIVEASQINSCDTQQTELMNKATHFNPVDLICSVKDYEGKKYDLTKHIDHDTGFISSRSQDGKELKALELPGLWNGAMADWNTIFVEVPASTFSPVKTINDLLRNEHQPPNR